jgi:DNA-binding transcriptional ArsR family regulator
MAFQAGADLAATFQSLAHPTRVQLLESLREPATAGQLAQRFGISRQAMKKHLQVLLDAGLVHVAGGSRPILTAHRYAANPVMLYVFKETVWNLGGFSAPLRLPPIPTAVAEQPRPGSPLSQPGLLLVHGDAPGRWYPLEERDSWTIGRDPGQDLVVPNDLFASGRHAALARAGDGWTVTDLRSRNGTWLDFARIPAGRPGPIRTGQVLTVGRSHFVFRSA